MTTQNDQTLQDQDQMIEKFKTRIAYGVAITWAFGMLFVYAGISFVQAISSVAIITASLVTMLMCAICGIVSAIATTSLGLAYLELLMRRYRPIVLDRRDVLTRPSD